MRTSSFKNSPQHRGCVIECLENRIAPATIFVGDPTHNDTEYSEGGQFPGDGALGTDDAPTFATPFVSTSKTFATDPISKVLGANDDVYYIKLTTGDRMVLFASPGGGNGGGGYTNFITGPNGAPIKGTVIAVFRDLNNNFEVDANELMGLSLGKNVQVQVSGTVNGDVLANYNDATGAFGSAADATAGTAKDLLTNTITFFGANAVKGTIAAGGAISGIKVSNDVTQILTGSAVNTAEFGGTPLAFDFNGAAAGGGDTLAPVVPGINKAGPSITNVSVGDLLEATNGVQTKGGKLQSGDGGPQAAGGSISGITIIADTNGWLVKSGAGGDGISAAARGGAGGKITSVVANGLNETQTDTTLNSSLGMQVIAGNGGSAFAGSAAAGGKGGDVSGISIGYEKQGISIVRSVNPMSDAVLIKGGDGGAGKFGGIGGNVTSSKAFAAPTLVGNDVAVVAGQGGASNLAGGRAGAGGSISTIDLQDSIVGARMIVVGGDGGVAIAGSAGAKGGSVTSIRFTGSAAAVGAGDGSGGTTGGSGGSVTSITIADGFVAANGVDPIRPSSVTIDAGAGAAGTSKRGGNGGNVTGVTVRNADLSAFFDINQTGLAGDGGDSKSGAGGVGGSVSNIVVNDLDTTAIGPGPFVANEATLRISAGDGGRGGDLAPAGGAGGAGGSIKGNNVITGTHISLIATAGNGGGALLKGAGGAGGSILNLAFISEVVANDVHGGAAASTATLTAGSGGAGFGIGAGGRGGTLNTGEVLVDGAIITTAGSGGAGGTQGGAGSGGSILTAAFRSNQQSVTVSAGDAGATGVKAGKGGSVTGTNVFAASAIAISSGDGTAGGAGGDINSVGVANAAQSDGPLQTLSITAGNGSGLNGVAGNGGSILNVDGYIATTGLTALTAGTGGAGTTRAANGGSITNVNFLGGGSATAEVRIVAGSATDSATVAKGGAGGNVRGIGLGLKSPQVADPLSIDPNAVIRHIAAGNGGAANPATGTGGLGGSVTDVRANHDIGVRSGVGFGFSTMGGIFAGSGGDAGKDGLPGSVTDISADAIASIVAGRPEAGSAITSVNLANNVTNIVLNGSVAATTDGAGTYRNFATANILGGVVNPTLVGDPYPATHSHANTFDIANAEFVDVDSSGEFSVGDVINTNTDGFVAARHFIDAAGLKSVRPEALLTLDAAGVVTFIDLTNANGQKVILP